MLGIFYTFPWPCRVRALDWYPTPENKWKSWWSAINASEHSCLRAAHTHGELAGWLQKKGKRNTCSRCKNPTSHFDATVLQKLYLNHISHSLYQFFEFAWQVLHKLGALYLSLPISGHHFGTFVDHEQVCENHELEPRIVHLQNLRKIKRRVQEQQSVIYKNSKSPVCLSGNRSP